MENIYVALDLETTGFDPTKDHVIEIAAIKFTDTKVLDTFESVLNPGIKIPTMISHITGIFNEELEGAPLFEDIKDELQKFISNHPIIGHNIQFDVNFLNLKGIPLKNPLLDTLQLAPILLPGLPSYSLETLTRILNIKHENRHRALSDTIASKDLFLLLKNKIAELDSGLLEEIKKILQKSTWSLKNLFFESKNKRNSTPNNPPSKEKSPKKDFTEEQYQLFFSDKTPLKKVIEDFENRPSQTTISKKITEAFKKDKHLLVEAGTGTGKTLAYLLSAFFHANKNNETVVVSTYTKNLQDQILNKDVPLLQKAISRLDPDLKIKTALVKGKNSYVSMPRFNQLLLKPSLEDHEVTLIIKTLIWLTQTETGDLDELTLQGKEFTLRNEICHDDLSPYKPKPGQTDFVLKAREKAAESNIIIVNHALLFQDCITKNILPKYERAIIDEAHHLEKVITDSLTINLSLKPFLRIYESIAKIYDQSEQEPAFSEAMTIIPQITSKTEILFGLLGIFMEKYADPMDFQMHYLIKETTLNSLEWDKVKKSTQNLYEMLEDLIDKLETVKLENDLFTNIQDLKQKRENLYDAILAENNNDNIKWVYEGYESHHSLKSAPINTGNQLRTMLFDAKKSIILTSATLQTDNNFDFIREQLALTPDIEAIALPSHFDYPDQVKIIIPEDLPKPAGEGYFTASCEIILNVIKKNKGRTLILFTSKKALLASYMKIAPELRKEGIEVLGQGITGGKGKILEHFKEEPDTTAIFGLASFWEGIDLPGDLLTCLVIQKLPFDPPNDPIIYSRSLRYTNSFEQYQLPRAIIRLKQGFGRLIRTHKDKGTLIILDSRITQNNYGARFLESLPAGIQIHYTDSTHVADLL